MRLALHQLGGYSRRHTQRQEISQAIPVRLDVDISVGQLGSKYKFVQVCNQYISAYNFLKRES